MGGFSIVLAVLEAMVVEFAVAVFTTGVVVVEEGIGDEDGEDDGCMRELSSVKKSLRPLD